MTISQLFLVFHNPDSFEDVLWNDPKFGFSLVLFLFVSQDEMGAKGLGERMPQR